MLNYASAKPENLVKVAATKSAEGYVSLPPRMQRAGFDALVRKGWLKKGEVPAPWCASGRTFTVYTITPAGDEVLKTQAVVEANPFAGGHGEKAQETFRLLDTKHSDWFHPAVKWVKELRDMPFETFKPCPTCLGRKWVRHDAEGNVIMVPAEPSNEYEWAARKEAGFRAWNGNCRTCAKHSRRGSTCEGRVFDKLVWKKVEVMVGHIVWPKGVQHNKSRFAYNGGNSLCKCALCGKGINQSGRVPLAHDKDNKALSLWVGEDCARKFAKVAALKPSKNENLQNLEYFLDDNYVGQGDAS